MLWARNLSMTSARCIERTRRLCLSCSWGKTASSSKSTLSFVRGQSSSKVINFQKLRDGKDIPGLKNMYGVCSDNFRKTWITCCRLFGEIAWLKSFYSALCLQILLLQLFPPISHLICRSQPAVYLSLLTPSILSYSDFVKSLSKARKSLRGSGNCLPWPGLYENGVNNRLSKAKYKKRRRLRPIREISTQRLPLPMWPPNWRMTGERMSGNSLRPLTCQPKRFTPLSWERRSSQRCRPGGWKNGFAWRWRRSDSGRMRWPKRWRPWSFDSLKQRSHCLRGGRGQRESWPPSFSVRRPPRRTEMGVREIARRRTSPLALRR